MFRTVLGCLALLVASAAAMNLPVGYRVGDHPGPGYPTGARVVGVTVLRGPPYTPPRHFVPLPVSQRTYITGHDSMSGYFDHPPRFMPGPPDDYDWHETDDHHRGHGSDRHHGPDKESLYHLCDDPKGEYYSMCKSRCHTGVYNQEVCYDLYKDHDDCGEEGDEACYLDDGAFPHPAEEVVDRCYDRFDKCDQKCQSGYYDDRFCRMIVYKHELYDICKDEVYTDGVNWHQHCKQKCYDGIYNQYLCELIFRDDTSCGPDEDEECLYPINDWELGFSSRVVNKCKDDPAHCENMCESLRYDEKFCAMCVYGEDCPVFDEDANPQPDPQLPKDPSGGKKGDEGTKKVHVEKPHIAEDLGPAGKKDIEEDDDEDIVAPKQRKAVRPPSPAVAVPAASDDGFQAFEDLKSEIVQSCKNGGCTASCETVSRVAETFAPAHFAEAGQLAWERQWAEISDGCSEEEASMKSTLAKIKAILEENPC